MSRKQIVRDLVAAQHRLNNHEKFIPSVLDELDRRRVLIDTTGGNTERRSVGSHADPAGTEATARLHLADLEHRILEALRIVGRSIDHLDAMCRNALGRQVRDEQRCPGYPVGATCGQLIGYHISDEHTVHLRADGLCDRCGVESDRDERRAADARRKRLARV